MKAKKTNSPNVAFRFNKLDKASLVELAMRLQMNQTQTVRVLVRESLAILKEREVEVPTRKGSHESARAKS